MSLRGYELSTDMGWRLTGAWFMYLSYALLLSSCHFHHQVSSSLTDKDLISRWNDFSLPHHCPQRLWFPGHKISSFLSSIYLHCNSSSTWHVCSYCTQDRTLQDHLPLSKERLDIFNPLFYLILFFLLIYLLQLCELNPVITISP